MLIGKPSTKAGGVCSAARSRMRRASRLKRWREMVSTGAATAPVGIAGGNPDGLAAKDQARSARRAAALRWRRQAKKPACAAVSTDAEPARHRRLQGALFRKVPRDYC